MASLVKRSLGTLVGLTAVTMGLTWLFLGMRAVMDVGGSCGSGGPYVIATPCPHGIPVAMMGGIFGGLIGLLVYAVSVFPTGPRLALLSWPALFLSLGYNFFEYGLRPPGGDGVDVGFLVCGVIFVLMGGAPLLFLLKPRTFVSVFWTGNPASGTASWGPLPMPRGFRPVGFTPRSAAVAEVERVIPPNTPATGGDPDSLVVALERLTALRDRGAITDGEFARAKARLLDKETP